MLDLSNVPQDAMLLIAEDTRCIITEDDIIYKGTVANYIPIEDLPRIGRPLIIIVRHINFIPYEVLTTPLTIIVTPILSPDKFIE